MDHMIKLIGKELDKPLARRQTVPNFKRAIAAITPRSLVKPMFMDEKHHPRHVTCGTFMLSELGVTASKCWGETLKSLEAVYGRIKAAKDKAAKAKADKAKADKAKADKSKAGKAKAGKAATTTSSTGAASSASGTTPAAAIATFSGIPVPAVAPPDTSSGVPTPPAAWPITTPPGVPAPAASNATPAGGPTSAAPTPPVASREEPIKTAPTTLKAMLRPDFSSEERDALLGSLHSFQMDVADAIMELSHRAEIMTAYVSDVQRWASRWCFSLFPMQLACGANKRTTKLQPFFPAAWTLKEAQVPYSPPVLEAEVASELLTFNHLSFMLSCGTTGAKR